MRVPREAALEVKSQFGVFPAKLVQRLRIHSEITRLPGQRNRCAGGTAVKAGQLSDHAWSHQCADGFAACRHVGHAIGQEIQEPDFFALRGDLDAGIGIDPGAGG